MDAGETIIQETRHWDENTGKTHSMRSKEEAEDYRYFPEPDLGPLVIEQGWIDQIAARIPELPESKRRRFISEYGLPEYDADLISSSRKMAEFFEATVALFPDAKMVSNWLMGEFSRLLNVSGKELDQAAVTPELLAKLLQMLAKGTISGTVAKSVFEEVFATGKDPEAIVQEKGLAQISDTAELERIVQAIIAANPGSVTDFRNGKDKALGFLVGQVMKETKGRANPQLVNELLRKYLA